MIGFVRHWRKAFDISIVLLFGILGCDTQSEPGSPVEPEDALATFAVPDGFKIELVAAEPLVADPVDMEIDEYGRLYVVEMHGYPLDKSGSGNVVLLSDVNGDGKMDKRTVFAKGLTLPTGVMRWKRGILVTDAPNVLYFEDTDNDGAADVMDTVLTGFSLSNPQHNMNNPIYGIDNWIYVAHEGVTQTRKYQEEFGDEGSAIIFPSRPGSPGLPKNANGRSIRFRPEEGQIELTASRCQFGHTFDAWGNWFGCNNSNQGYHEVIANRYFTRNPDLLVSNATQDMSDHLNGPEVFQTTTHPDRQLLTDIGVMTSGSGLTAYMGGAFPPPFDGQVTFITESVSNLVHVDLLKESGVSFTASRAFDNKEFLTSTDAWSRPVNLYVGPDGALYVLDYYRRVIESPEWMSDEAIQAGGLYDGSDRGRIYRITSKNAEAPLWTAGLTLGDASSAELVEELANPNSWWRMHAQRLLVDRADKESIPALVRMVGNSRSSMGRLHALWTLQGIGALTPSLIEEALKDTVAGIRVNAIELAELQLSGSPKLVKGLLALESDEDPKVRLQLLLTLGFVNTRESAEVRNRLLFKDVNNEWVQIAALSAPSSVSTLLLKDVLDGYDSDVAGYSSLLRRVASMVAVTGAREEISRLIQKAVVPGSNEQLSWQGPMMDGLVAGLQSRKTKAPEFVAGFREQQHILVATFFNHPSSQVRKACLRMLRIVGVNDERRMREAIERSVVIVQDQSLPDNERAEAIDFISLVDPAPYSSLLEGLFGPHEQPSVQLAALRTLSEMPNTVVSEFVLRQWQVLTPEIREAAIGTFLTSQERIRLLIDALESNKVQIGSISFGRRVRLMVNSDEDLRNRARSLFARNEEEVRKVNDEYQKALQLKGDVSNGKEVYVKNCAICHQIRGKMGVQLGPDLGTIHSWKPDAILANILEPNLSILSGYDLWEVELKNGESLQGIISSETSAAITLKNNGTLERTINRQDIQSIKNLNISPMPPGLEKEINTQEMADLLAFLRQN